MTDCSLEHAQSVLKQYWGFDTFRPNQFEVIQNALQGKDTFLLASTGAGKSLAFQLPALISGKTVICVSPLISLMEDQVQRLQACGISAAALNSSSEDAHDIVQNALRGKYDLLYMAPERVVHWLDSIERMWKAGYLCLISVDECHSISMFGHEFRPSYRELQVLRERFPDIPLMAVTATATKRVVTDIIEQLSMRSPLIVTASMDRINLTYQVRKKDYVKSDLTPDLFGESPAIVYCLKRADTEMIASHLQSIGLKAAAYHAKLDSDVRAQVHQDFICDRLQIVAATTSFGLGIDKADVRTVIHYGLCKSLEQYAQESGRAGRDGLPSKCVLFFNGADLALMSHIVAKDTEMPGAAGMFAAMKQFALTEKCRRAVILRYFDEVPAVDTDGKIICTQCDNCINPGQSRQGGIPQLAEQVGTPEEQGLFQQLRKWRSEQANAKRIAPYMIVSDKTLHELARIRPSNSINLLKVSGIGQSKATQFGTTLLDMIARYCAEHNLPRDVGVVYSTATAARSPTKKRSANGEVKPISNTVAETLRLHKTGCILSNIAVSRKLAESTIIEHLTQLAESGEKINWDLLPVNKILQEAVLSGMRQYHAQHPQSKAHMSLKQIASAAGVPIHQMEWNSLKILQCKFYNILHK